MNKITEFIRKERLYILLLVFVVLMNMLVAGSGHNRESKSKAASEAGIKKESPDRAAIQREFEKKMSQNKSLLIILNLVTLLILAIILLGIVVDIMLFLHIRQNKGLDLKAGVRDPVKWGLWDVAKVVILFLFFGYMISLIESALVRIFPLLNNDNFRMMLNSSILDILAVIFILYFALSQHKANIASLGISAKNFLKNVYYGIIGYIAAIPILVLTLIIIAVVVNLIKYVPEKQPVVDLFLKEKSAPFLLYTGIFAAIFGPIAEELFFRAFMYGALRKTIGIGWAMAVTAAVFSMLHTHPVGFLPIMVLGLVLTYLYEKTGSIVPSITVHAVHNFSMVGFVFLLKQTGVY